jgi:hydrogenase-1 operon protein HyaF
MKDFPIPLVALGPGSQTEDETLDYLPLPADMDTYRPPRLPEPEELGEHAQALSVLHAVLGLLAQDGAAGALPLHGLPADDLRLLGQVLGEGEASAVVQGGAEGAPQDGRKDESKGESNGEEVRIQESVFAGVWRVLRWQGGVPVGDALEVGPVPACVRAAALADVWPAEARPVWQGPLPPNVLNAPQIVAEICDAATRWQPGQLPYVVNLSLLPVTPEDIAYLDHQLGTGRVRLLSRGYGNCRITNTRWPNCWRVVYYNSFDKVILNTVEVVDLPEVAQAAPEDLRDAHERLADVLALLGAPVAGMEAGA